MCLKKLFGLLGFCLLFCFLFVSADVAPTTSSLSLSIREELQLLRQESMTMSADLESTALLLERTTELLSTQSSKLETSESERIKLQTALTELYTSLKNMTEKYQSCLTRIIELEANIKLANKIIMGFAAWGVTALIINIIYTILWVKKPVKKLRELVAVWL